MPKKKVAIIHNKFLEIAKMGGAEAVALWMIEALKDDYDVTLVASVAEGFSNLLKGINRLYGTNLSSGDFKVHNVPLNVWDLSFFGRKPWILRIHRLMRYCKKITSEFDVVISTYNEFDFGRRGIQYIHYPSFENATANTWTLGFLKLLYMRVAQIISSYSVDRVKDNVTIVNSRWTGEVVRKLYGINSLVVHPPVWAPRKPVAWAERKNDLICVSRLSQEKRIANVIGITKGIRSRGIKCQLNIVGPSHKKKYAEKIKILGKKYSDWLHIRGVLSREELDRMLVTHKYGIHGMKNEHFGIAVAEMVSAGCIPFVPDDGGQTEIVNNNDNLIYVDDEDAVNKIEKVIKTPKLQEQLRLELEKNGKKFTRSRFIRGIRKVVRDFLRSQAGEPGG